jgi:hypothetical protein
MASDISKKYAITMFHIYRPMNIISHGGHDFSIKVVYLSIPDNTEEWLLAEDQFHEASSGDNHLCDISTTSILHGTAFLLFKYHGS